MATNMVALGPKRLDEDILSQAPIKLTLGKEYEVKPLRILAARKWRQHLVDSVTQIMGVMKQDATASPAFLKGLAYIFLQFPEKLEELVFSYGPELPKDEVLESATDEQMARAFGQIVQVAFPFGSELQLMGKIVAAAATIPTSVSSI